MPGDKYKGKKYKYALCVVDVASRFKAAYPLTSKQAKEVSDGFKMIYKDANHLKYPKLLMVDKGSEFYGDVSRLMDKNDTKIKRGDPSQHRSQGIVERFNKTLAEKLFSYQYYKEMMNEKGVVIKKEYRNSEWVKRLNDVVMHINNEVTRLIKMKPIDAIKLKKVHQGFSLAVRKNNTILKIGTIVRYLYEPGELEGGNRSRATDPIWSVHKYKIKNSVTKLFQPTLYYLDGNAPDRYFVFEELQVIPS